MSPDLAYLLYGLTLTVALAAIAVFYYSKKRKRSVERAKYRMLEDDDTA